MELISSNKVSNGWHKRYKHSSQTTQCDMTFAIFLPETVNEGKKVPVLYWLSGLTCSDENFMQKAGAFKKANELGIAIVAPDTSPRGEDVADDENASYDFGLGAGFYVNATQAPYNKHYQMYDYVTQELPELIEAHFPVNNQKAISGHSMGGHGALVIGLRNPDMYTSISAFSPIVNPSNCPWGEKAFSGYLGDEPQHWQQYDATVLMTNYDQPVKRPILIEQGTEDQFLEAQLKPWLFKEAAENASYPITLNTHDGYDHSYFFISSFIDEHLAFHHRHFVSRD
ncbi:S-formylglutathione hydrolase [Pseudoalteromonas peptidolytica]|uniref:S-formylglutathione hydrolase n=1 Tax=Pseudoalteromonas peptidolytica F12-50-A1 TaxID=1315280 RepID=A0A8I0MVS4_9GAMM|nr:S-formylglutathione hydrolase [Pseudoalteromonas peptidolytica]MBE0346775.1 S-formylglutathione hydrolase [Pseudoalteromonas peptidolytica F12-50-A1]NLR13684.1 S-formylglutathione hydrolase [Pseudoalteromonas peptidolytica]GEK11745.1 S-formylglutathione hydrolase [Pseudoalteromonas peptidolytica]